MSARAGSGVKKIEDKDENGQPERCGAAYSGEYDCEKCGETHIIKIWGAYTDTVQWQCSKCKRLNPV